MSLSALNCFLSESLRCFLLKIFKAYFNPSTFDSTSITIPNAPLPNSLLNVKLESLEYGVLGLVVEEEVISALIFCCGKFDDMDECPTIHLYNRVIYPSSVAATATVSEAIFPCVVTSALSILSLPWAHSSNVSYSKKGSFWSITYSSLVSRSFIVNWAISGLES